MIDFNKLFVIAGPCVIESRDHARSVVRKMKEICDELDIQYIFKASYDKANRTSRSSFRGPGLARGLEILAEIKDDFEVPVLSDVHDITEIASAAEVLDVIQIPAFLCRQSDLLMAAYQTGKVVNVKKGQFLAPEDMAHVVKKFYDTPRDKLLLTERGASFGYHNLVVDFRSFQTLSLFGYPVVFDVTHSIQQPGAQGSKSGGAPEFIPNLARAGAACGYVDGFFFEVHENPAAALSDGANALPLDLAYGLLKQIRYLHGAARACKTAT